MVDWPIRAIGWLAGRKYIGWLAKSMHRSVIGLGFKFFSSRAALDKARDFDEFLKSANSVDAVFVTGQKFVTHHHESFRRIRRLILPNPKSSSFRFYCESVGNYDALAQCILDATIICQENLGIKVKWCPEIIQQSFMIADADNITGWVHAELVLPFSKTNVRPSFTVSKSRFENFVAAYKDIFEKLWAKSQEPNLTVSSKAVAPPRTLVAATTPPDLFKPGWVLNFNPSSPNGKKNISFKENGEVGEGINQNEWRWVLQGKTLDIYRKNGDLQNRFLYEANADRFICLNDKMARGIKDQTIYRAHLALQVGT